MLKEKGADGGVDALIVATASEVYVNQPGKEMAGKMP